MKKILILVVIVLLLAAANTFAACPLKGFQTGAACSANPANLDIKPDKPSNTNQSIPNPNKNMFAPPQEKPQTVRDLGSTTPVENNTQAGPYNSNCQFGVCPPKINNHQFDK